MGTIGGSLGSSDPLSDLIPPLIASVGIQMVLLTKKDSTVTLVCLEDSSDEIKSRTLTVQEFIVGDRKTAIRENEIIINISIL